MTRTIFNLVRLKSEIEVGVIFSSIRELINFLLNAV